MQVPFAARGRQPHIRCGTCALSKKNGPIDFPEQSEVCPCISTFVRTVYERSNDEHFVSRRVPEYRTARNRLLQQEVELRRATEAVAAARRVLPPSGVVPQDYIFQQVGPDDTPTDVRLSQLFASGKDTLVIYNFMFPRALDEDLPCPSCTSMLDAFDGAALHISQRVNLVVVAKAELSRILAHARARGWRQLHLLSSAGNTYNRDYFGENEEGAQMPMLNVFQREGEVIRHFWGSELLYLPPDPEQDPRHTDSIDPQWNLFDFTPQGRGTDWYPELSYS